MSVGVTGDGRWYCQYRQEDKPSPTKEYFGKGSQAKKAAEARDYQIKMEKKLGKDLSPRTCIYMDELAQMYIKTKKLEGRSINSLNTLKNLLNKHWLPKLCHKPVDELKYEDFLSLLEYYADKSVCTRNRYLDYLNAIIRWGIENEIVKNNPLKKWKKLSEPRRDVHLTVEDLRKIKDSSPPHLQWVLEVQWELGTRPGASELFSLRWLDVNFDDRWIRVRGTKTRQSDRIIPITESFRDRLLAKQQEATTEYILEYAGKQVKSCKRAFKAACRKASIAYPVRLYDIRHLFTSVMLSKGGDLKAVSRILGHSTTRMTANVYYHEMTGEKERALKLRPAI